MKKLMIVEDEKMIRQGIQAMVQRSPVEVEEIILCKNGIEALEVAKNQKIDVMITDIRMPKMDGITLVREIQTLQSKPKVVVISGYDDFSYAVEMLHYGAKEYILKPVDRDKINQLLIRLDQEIKEEQEQLINVEKISHQQLKYMLMNIYYDEKEIAAMENRFKDSFLHGQYVACCTNFKSLIPPCLNDVIYLEEINGQSVFIVSIEQKEELLSNLLKDHFVGVSKVHKSLKELRLAYEEAFHARKIAFTTGSFIVEYNPSEGEKETVSEKVLDQIVQMIGTDKLDAANKILVRILYKTKQGFLEPDHFRSIMETIVDKISVIYRNLLDHDMDQRPLRNIYEYDTAGSYFEVITNWIEVINERISTEFDDYKNKQKIQKAISFIQDNYNKNLNMAMVSNYISMNYSLFSYVFKQYTGMNFVNYLKAIRINEAKRLLEVTDYKIIEISNLVGYENEKHFMKTFRNACGVSPSEYRKNVQVGK